jgi:16S rRNA (adenine1518-N6/adenine1519-N6)-dimethyltransferase
MFAKKSLGQNFLINPEVVMDILRAADLKAGETVLEVGPGKGILTEALINAGAKVIAVEKDARLVGLLGTRFLDVENLRVIYGDILKTELRNLVPTRFKIVANIPYYITGEFLRNIFEAAALPERVVILVQKEVAERIVAKDDKESILSISIKAYSKPSIVRYVTKENFDPVPGVDSAVLLIENISKSFFGQNKIDEKKFFELIRRGFAAKRKKLKNNLPDINEAYGDKRAEELDLDDWQRVLKSW